MTDPSQLYQTFGHPILDPIIRVDRKPLPPTGEVPTHIIGPARMGIPSNQITLDSAYLPIMLSDFGSSYYPTSTKTRRNTAHTLPHLVPPEVYFLDLKQNDEEEDNFLSFPSDIWTLACTLFEIMGSGSPFSTFGGGILQDQVSVLGKFPEPWWSQWASRAEFYNDDATIDMTTGAPPPPFRDGLEERYDWFISAARRRYDMEEQEEEEKKAFLHMMRMMLRYIPSNRATIQEVVESEWMQKWGVSC